MNFLFYGSYEMGQLETYQIYKVYDNGKKHIGKLVMNATTVSLAVDIKQAGIDTLISCIEHIQENDIIKQRVFEISYQENIL